MTTLPAFSEILTKKRRRDMGSHLEEEKASGRVETLPCCRLKEPVEKRVSRFRKERELEMDPGILQNTFLDLFFEKLRRDLLNDISQSFQNHRSC